MLSTHTSHTCRVSRHSSINATPRLRTNFLARPAPRRLAGPAHIPINRNNLVCHGLFGLGLPEVAVIAGVAALIWGPSKLPEIGKGLGKTLKSFQSAAKEFEQELKTEMADPPQPQAQDKPAADAAPADKPKQS